MRILIPATGSAGHCFPLVPLARALVAEGHGVTVATGPGMRDAIAAAGLDVVGAGVDATDAVGQVLAARGLSTVPPDVEEHNAIGGEVFGRVLARAFAEDLGTRLAVEPVDLVLTEAGCLGAMLAARRAGIPCVVHAVSRRMTGHAAFEKPMLAAFAELAATYGVEVPTDGTLPAHRYLSTFPASLDVDGLVPDPQPSPIRTTPWNPPAAVRPRRPRSDRPWVYVTFGTAFDGAATARQVVAGLAGLDVDVLVAAGGTPQAALRGLGGRVRVEPFVPQAELIGEVSLAVHHAGSGTMLAAAAHGIPQLLLPMGADQHGNADAAQRAGIGRRLEPGRLDPAAVTRAAGELLAVGPHREAARRVAAEIAAMPAPAALAADVVSWARP